MLASLSELLLEISLHVLAGSRGSFVHGMIVKLGLVLLLVLGFFRVQVVPIVVEVEVPSVPLLLKMGRGRYAI